MVLPVWRLWSIAFMQLELRDFCSQSVILKYKPVDYINYWTLQAVLCNLSLCRSRMLT